MTIAVATQKGGTGKTTTSISLAAGLAKLHQRKVLLIDIDSQANTSKVLLPNYRKLDSSQTICSTLLNRNPLPIHPSAIPGLDIVPAHILLSNADVELTTAKDHREARLKDQLDSVKDQYEYIFHRLSPSIGMVDDQCLYSFGFRPGRGRAGLFRVGQYCTTE